MLGIFTKIEFLETQTLQVENWHQFQKARNNKLSYHLKEEDEEKNK